MGISTPLAYSRGTFPSESSRNTPTGESPIQACSSLTGHSRDWKAATRLCLFPTHQLRGTPLQSGLRPAADAPASYGCDERYEVGDFADVGEFVEHAVPVVVEHAVGFGVGFAYECFEEALAEDAGDEGECGAGVGQFEVDDPFALVEGFEPDVVAVEDDLVEGGAATSCSSAVCSDTSTSPPPCVTSDSCRTRCATPWNPPPART